VYKLESVHALSISLILKLLVFIYLNCALLMFISFRNTLPSRRSIRLLKLLIIIYNVSI